MIIDWNYDMNKAPKTGNRIKLYYENIVWHGWYEENLGCFMGMDSEWNLVKLRPVAWSALEV